MGPCATGIALRKDLDEEEEHSQFLTETLQQRIHACGKMAESAGYKQVDCLERDDTGLLNDIFKTLNGDEIEKAMGIEAWAYLRQEALYDEQLVYGFPMKDFPKQELLQFHLEGARPITLSQ